MDQWRPSGTEPTWRCWHCTDAVCYVLVCGGWGGGGAFTVNTKKSTRKKTTNKEAGRNTQQSDFTARVTAGV